MEQFNITKKTSAADLSIKVLANTIYPARTYVYKIKDAEFQLLTQSPNIFDGDITYDHFHRLIFKKIGVTNDLIQWTILVVTFINNLPAAVKTDSDLKNFLMDASNATSIDYWIQEEGAATGHYVANGNDVYKMQESIREGRIFQHIQLL